MTKQLGQVGTNCHGADSSNSITSFQSMTRHFIRASDVSALQFGFGNFSQVYEIGDGAPMTLQAQLIDTDGTAHPVTFAGASQGTVADGGVLISDPVTFTNSATKPVFLNVYGSNCTKVPFCYNDADKANGEKFASGADAGSGLNAAFADDGDNKLFYPLLILGQTSTPGVMIFGDSRDKVPGPRVGAAENDLGVAACAVGPNLGYLNASWSGARLIDHINNPGLLPTLAKYFGSGFIEAGINEILQDGSTSAMVLQRYQQLQALYPDIKTWFNCTLAPVTNSSDNWTTTAGQSVGAVAPQNYAKYFSIASDDARKQVNRAIRGGLSYFAGYVDFAAYDQVNADGSHCYTTNADGSLATVNDTGLWAIPNSESNHTRVIDGVHYTADGVAYTVMMTAAKTKSLLGATGVSATSTSVSSQPPVIVQPVSPASPVAPVAGTKLDLTGYKLTFSEEFSARPPMTVLGDAKSWGTVRPDWQVKNAAGTTIADTGFGNSHFVDPSSGYDPFDVRGGVLRITGVYPSPDTTGWTNWASGLLHTREMFTQCYGYFEARMKLAPEAGTWPAFWLLPPVTQHPAGGDPSQWQEADIVEAYGANPVGDYDNIHTTEATPPGIQWGLYSAHPEMATGFSTYGMNWQPDFVTFYFNGVVMGSKPTPTDWNEAMFMLLNLARDGASQYLVTPPPAGQTSYMSMEVDYVRAYSKDPAAVAVDLGVLSIPDAQATPGLYGASTKSSPAALAAITTAAASTAPAAGNLSIVMWEDAYQGDAQFTVAIDGEQIGGTYTCTGSQDAKQTIVLPVTLASGSHTITVNFLNDFRDSGGDRNLYLEDVMVGGKSVLHWLPLMSSGPQVASFTVA